MFRRLSLAAAASILMAGVAYADPIEGNWRTDKGSIAAISSCGGSFCIKLISGKHAGKSIGKFKSPTAATAMPATSPTRRPTRPMPERARSPAVRSR